MTDQNTTTRTSAADILTDLQQAQKDVQAAGRLHADQHTKQTKQALKAARARADQLLLDYHSARLLQLATITDQMNKAAHNEQHKRSAGIS
jgi:hypothetical protein